MEGLIAVLLFLAGILVRFGVPLGLTVLLVWLLKKLDRRWQAEAWGAANMPPNAGCWNRQGCTGEQRAKCEAYQHLEMPCWQYFRMQDNSGLLREECLDCEVFRNAPALLPA